jgi:hypothetical protein
LAANAVTQDIKLEVVTIPVSDVGRAKEFHEGLGWRLGADRALVTLGGSGSARLVRTWR